MLGRDSAGRVLVSWPALAADPNAEPAAPAKIARRDTASDGAFFMYVSAQSTRASFWSASLHRCCLSVHDTFGFFRGIWASTDFLQACSWPRSVVTRSGYLAAKSLRSEA